MLLLSIVVPFLNEKDTVEAFADFARRLTVDVGNRFDLAVEIVLVDDGSTDDSVARYRRAMAGDWRIVELSRNFGKEIALFAGMEAARGDFILPMDADLQHSPDLLPRMVEHWRNGAEVVYAVREHRDDESAVKQVGTKLFYSAVNRGVRFRIPEDAGDFRLMDRKVVQALRRLPERNRFMKGLYAWAGFKTVALPYTPHERASGQTSYSTLKLIHFAIDGMTAFTTWPLRTVTLMGLAAAGLAFLYGLWVVLEYFVWGNPVSGWSTLIVCILLFSGLQMLSLGVMGEYVGRIFEEVKHRPVYIVADDCGKGLPRRRRSSSGSVSANTHATVVLPDDLPDNITIQ